MLQQTRMEVVLGRYEDFLRAFPTLDALADASEDAVTAAWSGLGYYRRARMLRSGAIGVIERFGGQLPSTVEELMTIDGIGRYTAGAIASIAYNQRAPIVDGNIARIVSRLFATHRDAWPYATELVNASKTPRVFNQALMEIGALICKPRHPECNRCPLRTDCAALQRNAVARFPRVAKKTMTAVTLPLYVITDARGRLLLTRESGRLMHRLFVLPGSPFADRRSPKFVGTFRHTITNRRVQFDVYTAANGKRRTANALWVHPRNLHEIPHPSYVRKALQLAGII
jgi:A/G-specific adenine glycosylase